MPGDNFRTLERQLLAAITEKDRAIAHLQQERDALNRVLFAARKQALGSKEVTRSNSIPRIMAENAILEKIDETPGRAVSVRLLEIAAKRVVPSLSTATFRSYVFRLKERGLIESAVRGLWRRPRSVAPFSVGDQVSHSELGTGTVTGVYGPFANNNPAAAGGVRESGWWFDVEWHDESYGLDRYSGHELTIS